jgi:hypothetical protein
MIGVAAPAPPSNRTRWFKGPDSRPLSDPGDRVAATPFSDEAAARQVGRGMTMSCSLSVGAAGWACQPRR